MPFTFLRMDLPDVILVEAKVFPDPRGFFSECYKQSDFIQNGISEPFVQVNHSRSNRHVLRGLHYQDLPAAQGKLVMVLRGAVFDVAVDIRLGSPTYGRWVGMTLSEANHYMLYVPAGFAHGFCVLSEVADVMYQTTAPYAPAYEGGIRWDDPDLAIDWQVRDPILSLNDREWPSLQDAKHNFIYRKSSI